MAIDPLSPRSRFSPSLLLRGCVLGLVLAVGLHFGYVLLGSNFRTVVPQRLYRCGQPSARQLERFILEHGIRTVVNLRGCCVGTDWYQGEARVAGRVGVSQEDLGFSAGRLPAPSVLRQLVEVLDRSEYPILVHCHQGADRTGLAVVVYILMYTKATFAEVCRHLGPSSGHLPIGRTRYIDQFFDLYEEWLTAHGLEHSNSVFRSWTRNYYCPAEGRAELTLLEPGVGQDNPLRLRKGERRALKVRFHNTSIRTWRLQPGPNAGIHGTWLLVDREEKGVGYGEVGLLDAEVRPGEHIDLTIPLPPLPAGRFQLRVDMYAAQHGSFLQLGNDLLLVDVEVS